MTKLETMANESYFQSEDDDKLKFQYSLDHQKINGLADNTQCYTAYKIFV